LLADNSNYTFYQLSAIDASVKDVRNIISRASTELFSHKRVLLFIDEIHRFNKAQQDALLSAVEQGIITFIGATTENPSFEVIPALLSRCQVYTLKALNDDEIKKIIENALSKDEVLSKYDINIEDFSFIINYAAGDARAALNAIELASLLHKGKNSFTISNRDLEKTLQQKQVLYDKNGESHYDTISAFIKSMRGSDPDAAIY
jgi:putative ATPase